MENSTKSNWKLGAFVVVGLAILMFFIFYIGKNKNLFSSTITLTSLFGDVSGLAVGNNVRLAGIKIGTVTEIEIVNDSLAKVYTVIEKDAQKYIRVDSKMAIGSEGLMGDKVINIIKGTPDTTLIQDGAIMKSIHPFDTDKLLASFQKTLANTETITGELSLISKKLNDPNSGTIGRLLNDNSFANHVTKTVTHLESASSGLSDNMEAAKHSFLLRGYFKKKNKEKLKKEEEKEEEKERKAEEKEDHKKEKEAEKKEEQKAEEEKKDSSKK